jgi:hypothetical protein
VDSFKIIIDFFDGISFISGNSAEISCTNGIATDLLDVDKTFFPDISVRVFFDDESIEQISLTSGVAALFNGGIGFDASKDERILAVESGIEMWLECFLLTISFNLPSDPPRSLCLPS